MTIGSGLLSHAVLSQISFTSLLEESHREKANGDLPKGEDDLFPYDTYDPVFPRPARRRTVSIDPFTRSPSLVHRHIDPAFDIHIDLPLLDRFPLIHRTQPASLVGFPFSRTTDERSDGGREVGRVVPVLRGDRTWRGRRGGSRKGSFKPRGCCWGICRGRGLERIKRGIRVGRYARCRCCPSTGIGSGSFCRRTRLRLGLLLQFRSIFFFCLLLPGSRRAPCHSHIGIRRAGRREVSLVSPTNHCERSRKVDDLAVQEMMLAQMQCRLVLLSQPRSFTSAT